MRALAEMGEAKLPTYFIKNATKMVSDKLILHYDPLQIGFAFLPSAVAIGALSFRFAGQLITRFNARAVLLAGPPGIRHSCRQEVNFVVRPFRFGPSGYRGSGASSMNSSSRCRTYCFNGR